MRYVPEKCMLQSDRAEAGMILESKSDITNAAETAREDDLLADKVEHPPARKIHRKLKIVLAAVLAVIAAGAIGFGVYVGDYYHADDAALTAMESADAAAVLDANGAGGVQEQFPAVQRWILMGHSLGGVMAASYLDGNAQSWDGFVLLGAYSTADLSDDGVTALSITGDSDGVLNRQAAVDNEGNLGEAAREVVIPGGNHAQFGSYGPQDGDSEASLSPEKQWALTADEVAGVFL